MVMKFHILCIYLSMLTIPIYASEPGPIDAVPPYVIEVAVSNYSEYIKDNFAITIDKETYIDQRVAENKGSDKNHALIDTLQIILGQGIVINYKGKIYTSALLEVRIPNNVNIRVNDDNKRFLTLYDENGESKKLEGFSKNITLPKRFQVISLFDLTNDLQVYEEIKKYIEENFNEVKVNWPSQQKPWNIKAWLAGLLGLGTVGIGTAYYFKGR